MLIELRYDIHQMVHLHTVQFAVRRNAACHMQVTQYEFHKMVLQTLRPPGYLLLIRNYPSFPNPPPLSLGKHYLPCNRYHQPRSLQVLRNPLHSHLFHIINHQLLNHILSVGPHIQHWNLQLDKLELVERHLSTLQLGVGSHNPSFTVTDRLRGRKYHPLCTMLYQECR